MITQILLGLAVLLLSVIALELKAIYYTINAVDREIEQINSYGLKSQRP